MPQRKCGKAANFASGGSKTLSRLLHLAAEGRLDRFPDLDNPDDPLTVPRVRSTIDVVPLKPGLAHPAALCSLYSTLARAGPPRHLAHITVHKLMTQFTRVYRTLRGEVTGVRAAWGERSLTDSAHALTARASERRPREHGSPQFQFK
ncbi:hypothetical protein J6590_000146 [Homalodisca vitripennis]|nr:hypothetical protein J6590_000146 [Homalodisca vitripennis]